MMPVTSVSKAKRMTAGRMIALIRTTPLGQPRHDEGEVYELDTREWQQDTSDAIEQQVAAQQHRRAECPIFDALQGQRNEKHNDYRVEDHGGEDGRERAR